jgi:hypothetical protein
MENVDRLNKMIDEIKIPNLEDVFTTVQDSYLDLVKNAKTEEEKQGYEKGLEEIKRVIEKGRTDLAKAINELNKKVND